MNTQALLSEESFAVLSIEPVPSLIRITDSERTVLPLAASIQVPSFCSGPHSPSQGLRDKSLAFASRCLHGRQLTSLASCKFP